MIEPPGPKKTPRQAVPAADQGKEKGQTKISLSISDKPKSERLCKLWVRDPETGFQVRKTGTGYALRGGGAW